MNDNLLWNGKADISEGNGITFSIVGDHDNRITDMTNILVIGVDFYNQALTWDVAKSLTNKATDSDHIPCVIVKK